MKDKSLSQMIFQHGKLKILEELIDNPGKDYSISSLSRESGASYDLTHRFVSQLSELGIIERRKLGGAVIVTLNQETPYIEALKQVARIDHQPLVEKAEQYAEELKEKKQVESVILFGSVARGTPKTVSDIDILVLVESDHEAVEEYANRLASRYERDQNITITPMVEKISGFREDLENGSPFAEEVREDGKVLAGKKPW